jgi:Zn-dependent peptidase ImmA (M78 family)
VTPFQRARHAALRLRASVLGERSKQAVPSTVLIAAIASEDNEDFDIAPVHPSDSALAQADAVLLREFRQILVRNDVGSPEQAFLVAHEFGHWKLHSTDHDSCHKVIDASLKPETADSFGAQKIEAYGARERAELQANVFARELLLPRDTAKALYLGGKTARELESELDLPLELVRQQLLDALLLPDSAMDADPPAIPLTPTSEQDAAAKSPKRRSLVAAGPGTGKTATLLMRVQHLLATGIKASELLVLTFSNRAARELVDRLQQLGIEDAHDIWVGTFHAFGLEFLRKNFDHFALRSNFGVADTLAQIAVLEPHIYGLGLNAFSPLGDPLDWLNETAKAIQRAKDELADVAAFEAAVERSSTKTSSAALLKQRDIVKLYRCYEAKKQATGNLVDMGDLVMLPALALRDHYNTFAPSVGRFKHVLVDEYQDVNRASAVLVKALDAHAKSARRVRDAQMKIRVYVQSEHFTDIKLIEVEEEATLAELKQACLELVPPNDRVETLELFIEGDEDGPQAVCVKDLNKEHGVRVHLHKCKRIAVKVRFGTNVVHREFAPAATIGHVRQWAGRELKMQPGDLAEHVLQISGTNEQPDVDTHIGTLTKCPACAVNFDLVPVHRING